MTKLGKPVMTRAPDRLLDTIAGVGETFRGMPRNPRQRLLKDFSGRGFLDLPSYQPAVARAVAIRPDVR